MLKYKKQIKDFKMERNKINIRGVAFDNLTLGEAAEKLEKHLESGSGMMAV